ncbi:MAG: hypothetical protein ACOYYI_04450 [Chloroflexota bacterium]
MKYIVGQTTPLTGDKHASHVAIPLARELVCQFREVEAMLEHWIRGNHRHGVSGLIVTIPGLMWLSRNDLPETGLDMREQIVEIDVFSDKEVLARQVCLTRAAVFDHRSHGLAQDILKIEGMVADQSWNVIFQFQSLIEVMKGQFLKPFTIVRGQASNSIGVAEGRMSNKDFHYPFVRAGEVMAFDEVDAREIWGMSQ